MKTLLILRHAKSDWGDERLPDHDRPLNSRGRADAPRMGQLIREQDLVPELILSSTARRAHHTAQLVANACGYEGEILASREMYHADPENYVEAIRQRAGDKNIVMVVGHNPGMEELVEVLTKESVTMATANLAQVTLQIQSWRELGGHTRGKLMNFWRPREL